MIRISAKIEWFNLLLMRHPTRHLPLIRICRKLLELAAKYAEFSPVTAAENNTRVGLARSMACAGARAYNGGVGAEPRAGVQWAEPQVGVKGANPP